jgi:hypothetical protein
MQLTWFECWPFPAHAGYSDLDAAKAIQMRALGVSPDYAAKMARVQRRAGEIR